MDDPAIELEYAPFGVDSGLCMGVAATAPPSEGVTLQPCGVSAKTVWIIDTNDSPATFSGGYVPLINGSDTNFSHPFVLTYPSNGFPTDKPRPQLFSPQPDRFLARHRHPDRFRERHPAVGRQLRRPPLGVAELAPEQRST